MFSTVKQTALHLFNKYLLFILHIRYTILKNNSSLLDTHHMPQIT